MKETGKPDLESELEKAKVHTAERHLFLCLGPDCCDPKQGQETWKYMKRRTKELKLNVMRTKAACFRLCKSGPWLVIYPEGIWYARVTPERFERILQEHLLQGRPVEEWVCADNPLRSPAS